MYACSPIIRTLQQNKKWEYIINVTPDGHKCLFRQFEARDSREQVKSHTKEDENGKHQFGYANNLVLNESNPDIQVNMLYYK